MQSDIYSSVDLSILKNKNVKIFLELKSFYVRTENRTLPNRKTPAVLHRTLVSNLKKKKNYFRT